MLGTGAGTTYGGESLVDFPFSVRVDQKHGRVAAGRNGMRLEPLVRVSFVSRLTGVAEVVG